MAISNKVLAGQSFHILAIRLSAMGDVAMTAPVISAICKSYPNIRITVLTRGLFAPMFSQIDGVSVFEADVKKRHKGVLGLWKLYRELKALDIDAVADLHNVLRSNILRCFFGIGNIPFVQIDKGRRGKKLLTAARGKVFKPLPTTHQRYLEVFSKFGIAIDSLWQNYLPKWPLSEKVLNLMASRQRKWVGIAPFAAYEGKMYPLHLMEEVIDRLNASKKYSLLFFGGGERERGQFEAWEKKFDHTLNIVGHLSFKEELQLISNLDVMLSMDSGNGHLAAMYGIPTVTLWGVTHPYAGFYPYGQSANNALLADRKRYPKIPTSVYGNKMPEGYEKCMETIRPEAVVNKIEALLYT